MMGIDSLSNMQKILYIIVSFILLSACADSGKERVALDAAQAIINDRPDSALSILDSLEPSSQGFSQATLRRWQLLRLMAQNKCDTVFLSDSLQLVLAEYFDHHGTPNEKMWAHYLLGRACHDMGEAPAALKAFQEAAVSADTMAADCDFYNLCSVYGQMARLFESQHLYHEGIKAYRNYSRFSMKAGDMFGYVKGMELQVVPYYSLGDTAKCLQISKQCHDLYQEHGFTQAAESACSTAILILVEAGRYEEAGDLMRHYEQGSGLFDSLGNIAKGREFYYYSKGTYYWGMNKLDSAEFYYRKLVPFNINRNHTAFKGLLAVYQSRNNADSVFKYARLCQESMDSIQADDQSEAVSIANSLFKYTRMERTALQKELEARQSWLLLMFFLLLTLAAGLAAFSKIRKYKADKKAELAMINQELEETKKRKEQKEDELELMKTNTEAAIRKKQGEITSLEEKARTLQEKCERLSRREKVKSMMKGQLVEKFRSMTDYKSVRTSPALEDWEELERFFKQQQPALIDKVDGVDGVTPRDKRICMLCMLDFSTSEMANLLEMSIQGVSNAKRKLNKKIFGKNDAASLANNLMKL